MEKNMSLYWAFFILLVILSGGILYYKVYNKIKIEAYDIFEEVVNMDVDARIKNEKVVYKRVKKEQFHLDSTYIQTSAGIDAQRKELTSNASNKYNLMQHYLSDCTPVQVSAIDSLFQIVLQRAGISAKTVVKSIGKDFPDKSADVVTYSKDIPFIFLYVDLPMKKIEMPVYNFTLGLQGFIQCPFSYLLKKAQHLFLFWFLVSILAIALLVLILFTISPFIRKRGRILFPKNKGSDIIKHVEQTTREWLSVTDTILLDEISGEVKCDDEIVLRLKGLNLKLFALFVKNKDVCVVYDQLKVDIWNNENLSNATISIQIGKLEKELQTKIPFLSIENIRGVGYHLVVSKSPSDK